MINDNIYIDHYFDRDYRPDKIGIVNVILNQVYRVIQKSWYLSEKLFVLPYSKLQNAQTLVSYPL